MQTPSQHQALATGELLRGTRERGNEWKERTDSMPLPSRTRDGWAGCNPASLREPWPTPSHRDDPGRLAGVSGRVTGGVPRVGLRCRSTIRQHGSGHSGRRGSGSGTPASPYRVSIRPLSVEPSKTVRRANIPDVPMRQSRPATHERGSESDHTRSALRHRHLSLHGHRRQHCALGAGSAGHCHCH